MKRLIYLFVFFSFFVACSKYVDKPKNLIDKKVMTEIIAELSINDQVSYLYPGKNLESGTRYILQSKNVKPDDFVASYEYYVATQKLQGIIEDAQQIILDKDPKASEKINKQKKENAINNPDLEQK